MSEDEIVIGTRGSALALYQSNRVADMIRDTLGRGCRLEILKTSGDIDRTKPLAELGIVGVFTKQLERVLLAGEVDLCVHSLKDVPTVRPEGLAIAALPERTVVQDVLLANPAAVEPDAPLLPLKQGATVGTSSLRRRAQLLAARPDLNVVNVRGNVPTRAGKARSGELDAVVLAAAGVRRIELDLDGLQAFDMSLDDFVPAPGQGALAIETRRDNPLFEQLRDALHDDAVARCTDAERQTLHGLGAGCSVPLGAHAVPLAAGELELHAVLGPTDPQHPRPRLHAARVRGTQPQAMAELALRILGRAEVPGGESLSGKTILLARPAERAAEWVEAIEGQGGQARCHAPTRIESLPVDDLGEAVDQAEWVLFTSVEAARELCARLGDDAGARLRARRVGAVGPVTARALATAGVPVDLLGDKADGAGLAAALLTRSGDRPTVLLPGARGGRPELREALEAAGCQVSVRELYVSVPADPPGDAALADVDAVVLTSPSGARAAWVSEPLRQKPLVAIGQTTAGAIVELGGRTAAVASEPTAAGIVAALAEALA